MLVKTQRSSSSPETDAECAITLLRSATRRPTTPISVSPIISFSPSPGMSSTDTSPRKRRSLRRRRRDRSPESTPYEGLDSPEPPASRVKATLFTPDMSPQTPDVAARPKRVTTARGVRRCAAPQRPPPLTAAGFRVLRPAEVGHAQAAQRVERAGAAARLRAARRAARRRGRWRSVRRARATRGTRLTGNRNRARFFFVFCRAGCLLQFSVEENLNSGQATMLARFGASGLSLRLFRVLSHPPEDIQPCFFGMRTPNSGDFGASTTTPAGADTAGGI